MKINKSVLFLSCMLILFFLIVIQVFCNNSKKFLNIGVKPALSYYGSSGNEVIKIQQKLAQWGYYSGSIDGVYGDLTFRAVKLFQSRNNLDVDGIAGPKTLEALAIPSSNSSKNSSYDNNVNLLSRIIHGEARGESYTGMVAVAAVVLNRVSDSNFPKTIAGVIYQSGAFDAVSDGQINLTPDKESIKAAKDALNGWDPTHGCLYYWNPSTATSKWVWSREVVTQIGKHVFAK